MSVTELARSSLIESVNAIVVGLKKSGGRL
jgi:hypothetical protein